MNEPAQLDIELPGCAECGSIEGCVCRFAICPRCGADWRVAPCAWPKCGAPPEETQEERDRDFTDLEPGKRVRMPRGYIQICPKCERPGVEVKLPRWRYKLPQVDYVHAARVSRAGYNSLDSCSIVVEPKKKARKR